MTKKKEIVINILIDDDVVMLYCTHIIPFMLMICLFYADVMIML